MTKFFYFFLLNLLIFTGSHHYDALLLDPRPLDQTDFEIDHLELKGIENLNLQNLDDRYSKAFVENHGSRTKRDLYSYEGMQKPYASFYSHNFQRYPFPANNIGVIEANPDQDKPSNKDEFNEKVFPKTVTRWNDDPDLEDFRGMTQKWRTGASGKGKRKSEVSKRFLLPGSDKRRRYLDYTNSQMPFNEGKVRPKSKQMQTRKVPDQISHEKSFIRSSELRKNLRRLGRSIPKRLKEFQRLQLDVDDPMDDAILEYSRVRRFLDQQRSKKRIRSSTTLEVKEAAMSRVLDPNLNLDGILEPHVRKRRKRFTRKRDLSLRTRRNPR